MSDPYQEALDRVAERMKSWRLADLVDELLAVLFLEEMTIEMINGIFIDKATVGSLSSRLVHKPDCRIDEGRCTCGSESVVRKALKEVWKPRIKEYRKCQKSSE